MKDQGDPLKVPSHRTPFRADKRTTETLPFHPFDRTDFPVTAPQFPAAWGQAPAQPAPQYPPAAGGYPAQAPPQQFAPPAPPMAPAQQFTQGPPPWQPPAPGYGYPAPAPGYGPPPQYDPYAAAAPQAPTFTPASGTLDDYMNQKPAGAQYWKFKQLGAVNIGMVKRDLRDADVHQVSFNGQPVRRKDGSISTEMVIDVPMVNADGTEAILEIKGHQRKAFEDVVLAGSGGARRLPEGGSMIRATFIRTEPSNGGGSDKKIIQWEYVPADRVQGGATPQSQAPANGYPQQTMQPVQANGHVDPAMNYQAAAQQFAPQQTAPAQQPVAPPTPPSAQPPAPVPSPHPSQDPAYAAWLAQQAAASPGSAYHQGPPAAPQQDLQYATPVPAAQQYQQPAMQAPPAGAQGAPAPAPYAPPGMDPQAAQLFGNLLGGAPAQ